jgi:AcrR family transcriptional regulator
MRLKDEDKVDRIYCAAVKLINTEGFQGTSMSKIAKEAQLAAATIYLYFENKDDMLNKLYLHLKQQKSKAYLAGSPDLVAKKETFRIIWFNHYQFSVSNPQEFKFLENFANCPLIDRLNQQQAVGYYRLVLDLFDMSKTSGLLKNLSNAILYDLFFAPINNLVKRALSSSVMLTNEELDSIFEASWCAIVK